jgi:hypothetical protein
METSGYAKTDLGILWGILAGASIAMVLFVVTGDTWWLGMTGAGVAFGLGFGAQMESRED